VVVRWITDVVEAWSLGSGFPGVGIHGRWTPAGLNFRGQLGSLKNIVFGGRLGTSYAKALRLSAWKDTKVVGCMCRFVPFFKERGRRSSNPCLEEFNSLVDNGRESRLAQAVRLDWDLEDARLDPGEELVGSLFPS
jgi:hypothetical protein